jgi:RNA polymerase sigma factor (sigma-70 family)
VTKNLNSQEYNEALGKLFDGDGESYLRAWHSIIGFFRQSKVNDSEIEDLAQDVMDRVFAKTLDGLEVVDVHAYLRAVARNVAREHLRKQQRYVSLSTFAEVEALASLTWNPPQQEDLERIEETQLREDLLWECVSLLSPVDQEIFIRSYTDKSNREELAADMNVSANNLRVRLHRLKSRLRHSYLKKLEAIKNSERNRRTPA